MRTPLEEATDVAAHLLEESAKKLTELAKLAMLSDQPAAALAAARALVYMLELQMRIADRATEIRIAAALELRLRQTINELAAADAS